MVNQASALVLSAAAAELGLGGPVIRTNASVIGQRGAESVIVATAGWGYTVTVVLHGMRIAFTVAPRGFLRKHLVVEGTPAEQVERTVDAFHLERLRALAPLLVELSANGLRLEHRYGAPGDVVEAIQIACSLARRARHVEEQDDDTDVELAPTG
jgi:hypothetical protein